MTTRDQQRLTIVTRWIGGSLSTEEAVALLGTSERTAWRLRAAVLDRGAAGLVRGNRVGPHRGGSTRYPGPGSLSSPGRRTGASTTAIEPLSSPRTRGSSSAARRCAVSCGPPRSPPPGPADRRATGAGETGWPRPASWSRSTEAATTGSRVGVRPSPSSPGSTMRPGPSSPRRSARALDAVGYLMILRAMARSFGLPAAIYRDRAGIFAPTRAGGRAPAEATQVGRALAELLDRLDRRGEPPLVGPDRALLRNPPGPPRLRAPAGRSGRSGGGQRGPGRLPLPLGTPASVDRLPSSQRPGGPRPRSPTSPGSAPSAGAERSATTTPSGSRGSAFSSRRSEVDRSPGSGSRSSCGSRGSSSSTSMGAPSSPSRPRRIRADSGRSRSASPPVPGRRRVEPNAPAIRRDRITPGGEASFGAHRAAD